MLILVGYRGTKMVRNLGVFKSHRDTMCYVNAHQPQLLQEFTRLKVEDSNDVEAGMTGEVACFELCFSFRTTEPEDNQIELCDPEEKSPNDYKPASQVISEYNKRLEREAEAYANLDYSNPER